MRARRLSYGLVTPVRDEVENLPRLADAVVAQRRPPEFWIIVENGSTDGTRELAAELALRHWWIRVLQTEGTTTPVRGAPIVRALHAAVADAAASPPDLLVNLDADVSFEPDYFERLVGSFAADERLGIASGTLLELEGDTWRARHQTGTTVWGASRAYRWDCLQDVLPLEERLGWDGIDEFKANVRGWRTATLPAPSFRHHRPEGQRDGGRYRARAAQGAASHYVGYRPSYVVTRAVFNALRDPAALAMIGGFAVAAVNREPRFPDAEVIDYVRRGQRLRNLPRRGLEALGKRRDTRRTAGPQPAGESFQSGLKDRRPAA